MYLQKVLASRKELVEYDRQQREAAQAHNVPGSAPSTPAASPKPTLELAKAKEVPGCEIKPRERQVTPPSVLVPLDVTLIHRYFQDWEMLWLLQCNCGALHHPTEGIGHLQLFQSLPLWTSKQNFLGVLFPFMDSSLKWILPMQGLIPELVDYNLRRGSPAMRADVRQLLCLLTKDNPMATEELNALLVQRIVTAIRGHLSNPSFVSASFHQGYLCQAFC